jgi:hypothetical protein
LAACSQQIEDGIQDSVKVGFARSATGPCCRQYRRDQRPGCIGQICIVELVDIVFDSHHTMIICTRKRLFKHPLSHRLDEAFDAPFCRVGKALDEIKLHWWLKVQHRAEFCCMGFEARWTRF